MFPGGSPALIAASNTLNRPAQALKNGFWSDTTLLATKFRAPDGVTPRKSGSVKIIAAPPVGNVWGQLSFGKMRAASGIGFRFLFASGTLPCYLWSAHKSS